jgi:hypothetical protein
MMQTIQSPTSTKAIKQHTCDFCKQMIDKGTLYIKSVYKYEGVLYDWKTHVHCATIANKLNMYDYADEGVSSDAFQENITDEYMKIMTENYQQHYESKEFKMPTFVDRLIFVLQHHKVIQ